MDLYPALEESEVKGTTAETKAAVGGVLMGALGGILGGVLGGVGGAQEIYELSPPVSH